MIDKEREIALAHRFSESGALNFPGSVVEVQSDKLRALVRSSCWPDWVLQLRTDGRNALVELF